MSELGDRSLDLDLECLLCSRGDCSLLCLDTPGEGEDLRLGDRDRLRGELALRFFVSGSLDKDRDLDTERDRERHRFPPLRLSLSLSTLLLLLLAGDGDLLPSDGDLLPMTALIGLLPDEGDGDRLHGSFHSSGCLDRSIER